MVNGTPEQQEQYCSVEVYKMDHCPPQFKFFNSNISTKITNHQPQQKPKMSSQTANSQIFSLEPFPPELRFMIWEAAFTPRRIKLMKSGHRPTLDKMNRRLIGVGGEALTTFNLYYKRLFSSLGQRPILIHPTIDTLVFTSGLKGLRKMCRQYPEDMRKLKHIDIKASRNMVHGPDIKQWDRMDLSCLSPNCLITVRHCHDTHLCRGWEEASSGVWIIQALGFLKNSLLHGKGPEAPYTGPQLAAVFPETLDEWHDQIYFRTTADIRLVSWGRMRLNNENYSHELVQPSEHRLVWLAKNQVWGMTEPRRAYEEYPNNLHNDIFHQMQQTRLYLTKYQRVVQYGRQLRHILSRADLEEPMCPRRTQDYRVIFQMLAANALTLEANDSTNKGAVVRVRDGPEYEALWREIESAMKYPYAEVKRVMDGHLLRKYEAQKVATLDVEFEDNVFVDLVDGQFLDAVDSDDQLPDSMGIAAPPVTALSFSSLYQFPTCAGET